MHLPRAILFDMDGTLTAPLLDFPRIKREMGIGEQPILEALGVLDEASRQRAMEILQRHEDEAAERSTLNAGCRDLLDWLDEGGVRSAVVTRNSLRSTEHVMRRHQLPFDVLVTRDDGAFKPDPKPLVLACERLGIMPKDVWMVGDGIYDVQAGLAAGMATVWLSHGRRREFSFEPWRTVRDLVELHQLLLGCGV